MVSALTLDNWGHDNAFRSNRNSPWSKTAWFRQDEGGKYRLSFPTVPGSIPMGSIPDEDPDLIVPFELPSGVTPEAMVAGLIAMIMDTQPDVTVERISPLQVDIYISGRYVGRIGLASEETSGGAQSFRVLELR